MRTRSGNNNPLWWPLQYYGFNPILMVSLIPLEHFRKVTTHLCNLVCLLPKNHNLSKKRSVSANNPVLNPIFRRPDKCAADSHGVKAYCVVSLVCTQASGFLWDLGKRKVKFWSKKANFGVIFFGPVWESAIQPTHIWESFPKKNGFIFRGLPLSQFVSAINIALLQEQTKAMLKSKPRRWWPKAASKVWLLSHFWGEKPASISCFVF